MTLFLVFILKSFLSLPEGYFLSNDSIHFFYPSTEKDLEVVVAGNFNGWSKAKEWRMDYNEGRGYELSKPILAIKKPGQSFYEFTFRINGQLIDANDNAINVIHCAGYGSRYTISFK